MVYLKDLSSIELVQEQQNQSDFILMEPYNLSSYNASVLRQKYPFYNIDTVEGHHFITEYGNHYYMQDRTMNLPASSVLCPDDYTVKVEIIPNIEPNTRCFDPPFYISCSPRPTIYAPLNNNRLTNECFSFE